MICLRELSKADIPVLNAWRNDKEIIASLGSPFRYVNGDVDLQWYESYMKNRQTQVRCAICLHETGEMVGIVNLTNIDSISRSAEFSIMIGTSSAQNRGVGTEATKQMIQHAFLNLNLNRVYLSVLESNVRAQRVYEKVGFIKEGIMRQAWYKNGSYHHAWMMSILKDEFECYTI
jgi:diamine N-acetyltransferase